jgi:hypothetical protein
MRDVAESLPNCWTDTDDEVRELAHRGLRVVFPGAAYANLRRKLKGALVPRACGKRTFEILYEGAETALGPPEALPRREKLAFLRLAIRLVSRGPREFCECRTCRDWRRKRG